MNSMETNKKIHTRHWEKLITPIGLIIVGLGLLSNKLIEENTSLRFIPWVCLTVGITLILVAIWKRNKKTNKETINQNKQN